MILIKEVLLFVTALSLTELSRSADCDFRVLLNSGTDTSIRVENTTIRTLTPQFFGFNLELVEFQNSLWDSSAGRVRSSIVPFLRRFPGAVYRYPGGTVANNFDWKAAVGPFSERTKQKIVDWQAPQIVQFGPAEYLRFVQEVGGTAWYVVNLHGSLDGAQDIGALVSSASQLAQTMKDERSKGLPAVFRWELGNELDRGKYLWPPSKYIESSKAVSTALRRNYEDADFVGMAQDWAHTGFTIAGTDYNTVIALGLRGRLNEFSAHAYYDGPPWGPILPRVVDQICKNNTAARHGSPESVVWVTEHGRTPTGTPDDPSWKTRWPQTGSLGAAISAADMMVSLVREKRILGGFIHSLHGTSGPWPMFHKQPDGEYRPSVVFWAMLLLRETMQKNVLKTSIVTSNSSRDEVGYDANAVVLSNDDQSKFSLWMVNRGKNELVPRFQIPFLADKRISVKYAQLTSSNPASNNYTDPYKIFPARKEVLVDVSHTGEFALTVPANAVYVAEIQTAPIR